MKTIQFLLLALILTLPTLALSQEDDPAVLYGQAVEEFKAGNKLAAAELLERAFHLDPDPVLAYNIGKSYDDEGVREKAKEWYIEALSMEGLEERERKRSQSALDRIEKTEAELQARVEDLKPTEGKVLIKTNTPAEVFIDGALQGKTPFEDVVKPGTYLVRIEAEGYDAYVEEVSVEAGETLLLSPTLATPDYMTWVYVSGGVAAIGLGLGITGDIMAYRAYDDAENALDNAERLKEKKDLGENMRLLALGGYSVASVALVTGVVFYFIDASYDEESYEAIGGLELDLGPDRAGLGYSLRW